MTPQPALTLAMCVVATACREDADDLTVIVSAVQELAEFESYVEIMGAAQRMIWRRTAMSKYAGLYGGRAVNCSVGSLVAEAEL